VDFGIAYTTGCEIREAAKKRFDSEGIEILHPYRNLVILNPQDLPSQKGGLAEAELNRDQAT
jgi:small conductance mechanosensitive channel